MDIAVNYVAVVVATIAAFVIGWAWYSPLLFVKPWLRAQGKDPHMAMSSGMKMPYQSMLIEFFATLVLAYVLARLSVLLGITSWDAAVEFAVWIWLGFYAAANVGRVLWEGSNWTLYAINTGRWLVTLVVMSLILGLWH